MTKSKVMRRGRACCNNADDMDAFMTAQEHYQELNRSNYLYIRRTKIGFQRFPVLRYKTDALDYLPDIEYHNNMKNFASNFIKLLNKDIERDNYIIGLKKKELLKWIKKHGKNFTHSPTKK